MSEEQPSNPIKGLVKTITDIGAYVAAFTTYLVAIRGTADTPYPKTTTLLTIFATSVVVVSWRWSQLKRKKLKRKKANSRSRLNVENSETPRQGSLLARFFDPLSQSSRENYMLPLFRRRIEGGVLFSLIVLTLGWTVFNFRGAFDEWGKDPALACSPDNQGNSLLVVVADLLQTNSQQQLLISDKIFESLVSHQRAGQFDVCRLSETIQLSTLALETAEKYKADVVVWGRSDVIYEIHLEVPAMNIPDRKLSELSSTEAASVEFQFKEPEHIAYVTQFILSELQWLNGQIVEAQTRLIDVLAKSKLDSLDVTHPRDFADGYFLLGLFYDPGFSEYSNPQKSLEAYASAIILNPDLFEARLNHGLILRDLGRAEEAILDFTFLIENNTPLKGSAYIGRGTSQNDPAAAMRDLTAAIEFDPAEAYFYRGTVRLNQEDYQGAINDFEQAVALDPQGFYTYHLLGQAQLYAGEMEAAQLTYIQIVPYLDEESRQQVILELEEDAQNSPEITPTVEEIIRALKAAKLP
jgi:tetratricopeptide (TPR) repeat protein